MPETIAGVVKDGLVVPASPLPEGASVRILICEASEEEEQALQEELNAWRMAAANSLEMVERMLEENAADEKR
jgi:hypothetical protein